MNMMAQWEDEAKNRQVQFSIGYSVEAGTVAVNNVTPTKVTFICPESNTALHSVGVHTAKGKNLLAGQFENSGKLQEFVSEINKRVNEPVSA